MVVAACSNLTWGIYQSDQHHALFNGRLSLKISHRAGVEGSCLRNHDRTYPEWLVFGLYQSDGHEKLRECVGSLALRIRALDVELERCSTALNAKSLTLYPSLQGARTS